MQDVNTVFFKIQLLAPSQVGRVGSVIASWGQAGSQTIRTIPTIPISILLASCLIYARACVEYICGGVLFQDVTVREIRGR